MATSPIYNWPEPDNTDLVKNGALAIRTLGDAIDTTMGTMVAKSIIDAKGDLIAGSAADTALRLAVGANDLLLTAASGEATGLKYTGAWTTYTPTLTNLVKGNGTEVARYCQIGKTVTVFYSLTLGSTSSISTAPIISLPVTNANTQYATGTGTYTDAGVLSYFGRIWMNSSTGAYGVVDKTNSTYSEFAQVSATVPFTWATGDIFILNFSYEVA